MPFGFLSPEWVVLSDRWLRWVPAAAVVAVAGVLVGFAVLPTLAVLQPVRMVEVAPALPALRQGGVVVSVDNAGLPESPAARTVQAAGWLEPSPYPVVVSALTDGILATMDVLEGSSVKKGQVLATLVADDVELALRHAEAGLARAHAALAGAQAEFAAADSRWDAAIEVTRGLAVAEAELGIADSALAAHPALIREAEANRSRWREELDRRQLAGERGAASQREVSIAREEFAARKAEVEALEAQTAGVEARRSRAMAELAAAFDESRLRLADRLALDGATASVAAARASVALAEATLAQAQLERDRTTLRSPIDGNVLRRIKSPGEKVRLGTDNPHSAHVAHLYDPARLQVRVDVPLGDAAEVSLGQACDVVVDILPDTVFRGEVLRITHEADLQKNTLEVQVRVIDPSPLLKPEMLTRVRFLGRAGSPDADEANPANGGRVDSGAADARVRIARASLDGDRVWAVRERADARGSVVSVPVMVLHGDRDGAGSGSGDASGEDPGLVEVSGALRVGDLLVVLSAGEPIGLAAGETVRFRAADAGTIADAPAGVARGGPA